MKVLDRIRTYQFDFLVPEMDNFIRMDVELLVRDLIPLRKDYNATRHLFLMAFDKHYRESHKDEDAPYIFLSSDSEFADIATPFLNVLVDDRFSFGYLCSLLFQRIRSRKKSIFTQDPYPSFSLNHATICYATDFDIDDVLQHIESLTAKADKVAYLKLMLRKSRLRVNLGEDESRYHLKEDFEKNISLLLDDLLSEEADTDFDVPHSLDVPNDKKRSSAIMFDTNDGRSVNTADLLQYLKDRVGSDLTEDVLTQAIYNADFKLVMDDATTKHLKDYPLCLICKLKTVFSPDWYEQACKSLEKQPKEVSGYHKDGRMASFDHDFPTKLLI